MERIDVNRYKENIAIIIGRLEEMKEEIKQIKDMVFDIQNTLNKEE